VAFTTVTSTRSRPIPRSSSARAAPTADQRPVKPAPRTTMRYMSLFRLSIEAGVIVSCAKPDILAPRSAGSGGVVTAGQVTKSSSPDNDFGDIRFLDQALIGDRCISPLFASVAQPDPLNLRIGLAAIEETISPMEDVCSCTSVCIEGLRSGGSNREPGTPDAMLNRSSRRMARLRPA
jgi:hypothetical protein